MLAAIIVAGGLGAMARFMVDGAVGRINRLGFPLGTIVVNATGSLLVGLACGLAMRGIVSEDVRLVVTTGFLGGYTTFSTAYVETVRLVTGLHGRASLIHLFGMFVVSFCAAALGFALSGAVI